RDVDRVDRQDDNAAARLFAAATLQQYVDRHPDLRGLIVFLFVFREMVDAYQNRFITHAERLHIALRTYYFLEMWLVFIDAAPLYSRARNCISREAIDITRILVNSLISLIFVYRDYYPTIPLLPWHHSTETCEHAFGNARRIIDFTMLDFYQMGAKLEVTMREAELELKRRGEAEMRARASGYFHTYRDIARINLVALTTFP
ncbi:hypothetical protein GGX14DRAFT_323525, partial [Mycena pura]